MIGQRLTYMLAGAAIAMGAHGGAAQETGGVRIDGSVHNVTTVKHARNAARGNGAKAYMSVGSIGAGAHVDGDLMMDVTVDGVDNYADGAGKTAVTSIGSVHKGVKASGEIIVHTGDVTNVSNGAGETSCVIIGSKGQIPECDR